MPVPQPNYTGTHAWDANAILNYVLGQHGTASPGANSEFLRIGGRHEEAPGSATGTLDMALWLDERGYISPHVDIATLFSSATVGSGTGTGTTMSGFGAMKEVIFLVDVTGTGGSSGTLDLFIDTQLGGTRFVNIARNGLMTGTQQNLMILTRFQATGIAVASVEADAGIGTIRPGFGDTFRVRYTVGSNATSQVSFNVFVSAIG